MRYLIVWIRESEIQAIRSFKTQTSAERMADDWANDPESDPADTAVVWDLKGNSPVYEVSPER